MSKQIKQTQKFILYVFSILLGAVSALFVSGKDRPADYELVNGFEMEKTFFPSVLADSPHDGGWVGGADADGGGDGAADGAAGDSGGGGNGGGGDHANGS